MLQDNNNCNNKKKKRMKANKLIEMARRDIAC